MSILEFFLERSRIMSILEIFYFNLNNVAHQLFTLLILIQNYSVGGIKIVAEMLLRYVPTSAGGVGLIYRTCLSPQARTTSATLSPQHRSYRDLSFVHHNPAYNRQTSSPCKAYTVTRLRGDYWWN